MARKINTWIKMIIPWLFGFLFSAAGMFLGYNLGSDTASLLGGEPGIWARICKGLVWGGLIGGLQWPIVRAIGVHPIKFIAASAVGFAMGYILGQTIQGIMTVNWNLSFTGYWSAVITFGLFLGLSQWWIFRRHMQRASLWILISVIGWILTGMAWINFRGASGEDSIMYGFVAGLGLVWLVRSQKSNGKVKES